MGGWTDEKVAELTRLWEQGLSTGEIGRRLDVSKNAVVGKAHRLGLASRPSPIKGRNGAGTPRITSVLDLTATTCRWPIGDPRKPGFHFCGRKTVPGKPYCAEHCGVAYVQSSSRSGGNRSDDQSRGTPSSS